MAEEDEGDDGDEDEDELPYVDHGPLNEGPWENWKGRERSWEDSVPYSYLQTIPWSSIL